MPSMAGMTRLLPVFLLGLTLAAASLLVACGGGGEAETPGERITDPARVPSSTPVQNPTLYKIQGNEVILTGGSAGAITPIASAATAAASEYVIKEGDFCSTIAAANNVTLEELQKANRNMNCDALKIGDKIKIPAPAPSATATRGGSLTGNPTARPGTTSGGKTYTVAAGDTCSAIASANEVTLQAFLAANNSIDADCTNLKLGQVVTIP